MRFLSTGIGDSDLSLYRRTKAGSRYAGKGMPFPEVNATSRLEPGAAKGQIIPPFRPHLIFWLHVERRRIFLAVSSRPATGLTDILSSRGRSSVWLERLPVTQEVASSSLVDPAIYSKAHVN